jgi:hypothetical protein
MKATHLCSLVAIPTLMLASSGWAEPINSQSSKLDIILLVVGAWGLHLATLFGALSVLLLVVAFIGYRHGKKARATVLTASMLLVLSIGLVIIRTWLITFFDDTSDRPCGTYDVATALDTLPCTLTGSFVSSDSLIEHIEALCEKSSEVGEADAHCRECFHRAGRKGLDALQTLVGFEMLESQSLDDFRASLLHAENDACENSPQEVTKGISE